MSLRSAFALLALALPFTAAADPTLRDSLEGKAIHVRPFDLAPDAVGPGGREDRRVLREGREKAVTTAPGRAADALVAELRLHGLDAQLGGGGGREVVLIEGTITELELGRWGRRALSRDAAATIELKITAGGRTWNAARCRAITSRTGRRGPASATLLEAVDDAARRCGRALADAPEPD